MLHHTKVRRFPDKVDQFAIEGRRKELHVPYRYEYTYNGRRYRLTAPAGFKHDGASVPRAVWSFYPPHPLDRAAIFHDLLYRRQGKLKPGEFQVQTENGDWVDVDATWTRKQADLLFREMIDQDPHGPGYIRRSAAYWAVRGFGRWAWD